MRKRSLATLLFGFALVPTCLAPSTDVLAQIPNGNRYTPRVAAGNPAPLGAAPLALEEISRQPAESTSRQLPTTPPAVHSGTPPQHAALNAGSAPAATTAKEWVGSLLAPPGGSDLFGKPITLSEALGGGGGRQRQTEVVTAYWQLAVAVGSYHAARQASLKGSSTGSPAYAKSMTELDAELELIESKLQAVRAQHRLAQLLQWPEGELPLPASLPHAGSYKTRYDEIYAGRFSRRAWELDQSLPLLYELIQTRAAALGGARADGGQFGSAAGEFLEAVGEYNLAIAEYALLAAGDSLSGRDLVPLLIRVERGEEQVAGSRGERSVLRSDRQPRLAAVPPGAAGAPASRGTSSDSSRSSLTTTQEGEWRRAAE